jgi:uncharacterized membrane protein HdeD (DUF308 family)
VLATSVSELYVLGVVILLRGLIALMLYLEQRSERFPDPGRPTLPLRKPQAKE